MSTRYADSRSKGECLRHRAKRLGFEISIRQCRHTSGRCDAGHHVAIAGHGIRRNLSGLDTAIALLDDWQADQAKPIETTTKEHGT